MSLESRGSISNDPEIIEPRTQNSAEGGGIPPTIKAPPGSGEADNSKGPELSDEDLDLLIILALDDPNLVLPGLDGVISRYSDIIFPLGNAPLEEQVNTFLDEAGKRGLIKEDRPLTLREYLGAFMPPRE